MEQRSLYTASSPFSALAWVRYAHESMADYEIRLNGTLFTRLVMLEAWFGQWKVRPVTLVGNLSALTLGGGGQFHRHGEAARVVRWVDDF